MTELASEGAEPAVPRGGDPGARLDAQLFARSGQSAGGVASLAQFGRLVAECRGDEVRWSLQGSVDGQGACWLSLDVAAVVVLQCQRCLADLSMDVRSAVRFRLVFPGEEWGDEDLEDDSFEALEIDGPLDLAALVEDELLLALPSVALHAQCELPAAGRNEARQSPFEVLGQLKKGG